MPYRSLIPEKLDGIAVAGIGISVHRDALPLLRMQPEVQNAGYAAGVAAAMACRSGKELREFFPDTGETVSSAPFVRTNAPL